MVPGGSGKVLFGTVGSSGKLSIPGAADSERKDIKSDNELQVECSKNCDNDFTLNSCLTCRNPFETAI